MIVTCADNSQGTGTTLSSGISASWTWIILGFLALVAVAVAGYIVYHNRKSVSVRALVPFCGGLI